MAEHRSLNLPTIDTAEYGAPRGGERQRMDRRLFMQLIVLRDCANGGIEALKKKFSDIPVVIYAHINDASAYGILTWSEDAEFFVDKVQSTVRSLSNFETMPEFSMLGRTYSVGYEQNLGHWLLEKPIENVLAEENAWAVWYPLKRKGSFQSLSDDEKAAILREHGMIGRAYGAQGLAADVRLACHGLDQNDNDFVIGLIGKELFPLSHVVQSMRKTKQTSQFMREMGPFFVGYALWKNSGAA